MLSSLKRVVARAVGGGGLLMLCGVGFASAQMPPDEGGRGLDTAQLPVLDLSDSTALLPHLDFRRWPEDAFYEIHVSRVDVLSQAHGAETGDAMLDLAELYLSQMLIVEAASFVYAASQTDRVGSPRFLALQDAVNLLQGNPITSPEKSLLFVDARPDRGLWMALNSISSGDAEKLRESLGSALQSLVYQSGPVARHLLPLFLEAAIALRDIPVSEVAASLMKTLPELVDAPRGQFLLGSHQINLGNEKSALEAFFEAASGWDRYAARSRVAIADLALADGGSGALLAARDVISAGVGRWRDDPLELTVLERQAQVNSQLEDPVAVLLAYRRMLTRYPGAPETKAALETAGEHLEALYRDGETGKMSLSNWISVHQVLLPTFRFLPSYATFNEKLADKLFDFGGIMLAIDEYRQTLGILDERGVLSDEEIDPAIYNRVRLKLALALERAGLWQETLETLAKISEPLDVGFRDRVNKLRVEVLAELGDNENILRTYVESPDANTLRKWGQALFVRQDWAAAKQQYQRLLQEFPGEFRLDDASYLLIAAYRDEDRVTAKTVAQSFPDLSGSEGLAGLAKSLLEEPAPLMPLRQKAATDRIENFERTVDLISGSGF